MNIRGREGNSIEAIKEAADAVTETIKNVRDEAQESWALRWAEPDARTTVRAAEYGKGTLVVIKGEKRGHFRGEFGDHQNSSEEQCRGRSVDPKVHLLGTTISCHLGNQRNYDAVGAS
jgi:hypothetical protein